MGRRIRKPIILALSVLPIFLLTGCSSTTNEEQQNEIPKAIELNGQLSTKYTRGSLKLQVSKLSSKVQVGCLSYYSVTDELTDETTFFYNIDDNQRFSPASGSQTLYYPVGGQYVNLYTWIPYNTSTGYTSKANNVSFTIKSDQSTDDDYLASDLMFGKSASINKSTTSTTIKYNHLLSRIDIYLTAGTGVKIKDLQNAEVYICGFKPTIDFSLTDGSLGTASGEAVNVKAFTVSSTASSDADLQASIRVPPQTLLSGSTFLMIKMGTETILTTTLSSDTNLEGNKYYDFEYEIKAEAINFGGNTNVKAFKIEEITGTATEQ